MSNHRLQRLIVITLLLTAFLYTEFFHRPGQTVLGTEEFARKIEAFPKQIGPWKYKKDVTMSEGSYNFLAPRALIFREYVNGEGDTVLLVVVFHENDRWGAHNVEICYTSQGWSVLKGEKSGRGRVNLPSLSLAVNRIEVEKPQERRTVVYWWFAQGKKQMADRLEQMLSNITSSLLHGYCASGLVRISTQGGEKSLEKLDDFAAHLLPAIEPYLP